MNKKVIYIGVGLLAIGGLAYYFFMKPKASSSSTDESRAASDLGEDYYDIPSTDATSGVDQTRKERRQDRRQTRRDCRAEAKAQGLRGRAKRDFRKKCKAEGGFDDGMESFDGMFE
jgi:hypothetical protein